MSKIYWMSGYYPPALEEGQTIQSYSQDWSMGPSAGEDWVWFNDGDYTEQEIKDVIKNKPYGTKSEEEEE